MIWNQADAIALCSLIEDLCPAFNYHVALTGGLLYKKELRKDADILFYSIRQKEGDRKGLTDALNAAGLCTVKTFGWMQKAIWKDKPVDLFFPETPKSDSDGYSGL